MAGEDEGKSRVKRWVRVEGVEGVWRRLWAVRERWIGHFWEKYQTCERGRVVRARDGGTDFELGVNLREREGAGVFAGGVLLGDNGGEGVSKEQGGDHEKEGATRGTEG